jgi:hypothetical protein
VGNIYGTNQLADSRKQAASAACATSRFAHFLTLQILTRSDLSIFLCHPFEKDELLMLSVICLTRYNVCNLMYSCMSESPITCVF